MTHTSDAHDFGRFRGRDVFVVGAGQSALEAAGFLGEAGAHVEVLIRDSVLHWLGHREWMHAKALSWMFYGRADVGPAGMSLIVQRPHLFRRLPRGVQDRWGRRAVRPAVSHRVAPRTQGIAIHVGRGIVRARSEGERLHVWLNDGTERTVHHVVLGTGYRVNVSLYPFLSPEILARVDVVNGYPRLDTGFETSLPGLHVIGAPAAWSFGPLMRFVAGTEFTARALARRVLQAKNRSVVSCFEQNPVRV